VPPTDLEALRGAVRGPVEETAAARERAGRDGSHLNGRPRAVLAPRDVDDVVAAVAWARSTGIPLVPRGGGTSLDGESVPADGAVVVDLSGWRTIREVSALERWARVEPGVVNLDLQHALAPHRMFFPPNPGSWATSTIGGHVGTNASGPRSFRYGPTRAWVRALEVVLGTGERARLGSIAPKRSVGPELGELLVGSEGTLGIVTEVTVRLAPRPAVRWGAVVPVPPGARLGALAGRLAAAPGTGLSALEFVDAACARALVTGRGVDWPADGPLVLLEIEADDPADADARLGRVAAVLRAAGVPGIARRYDDADRLWSERGASGIVLDEQYGERIREDVAVPLPAVDALAAAIDGIARAEGVPVYTFGHLGEGSLHPNFVVDPTSPPADRIRSALYDAALGLGGTISGEHGVGRVKRPFVARELGPTGVRLLRAMKAACDPDGILNPGKLYPP